jgi:hypothetical protein
MLFKQAARGDERAFLNIKNVEASSITTGMGVCLRIGTTASFDGTSCVRSASGNAADLPGFLGVSVQDIPSNSFGLVQIFGNCLSVLVSQMNTSITLTAGDPLTPSALAGALSSVLGAPTYAGSGFGWVICSNPPTNSLSQAGPLYASGFIRCLK